MNASIRVFALLLCAIILAACGGGDQTPVAVIKAGVPHPVANAATVSGGSAAAIHLYQALYGMAPGNVALIAHTAQATADPAAFARNLANNFAGTSSTALAKLVLDNLGVTATTVAAVNGQGQSEYAILLVALGQMFTVYGPNARGQIILNATSLLAGLESDASYGGVALTYNHQASANYAYSSNPTNAVAARVSAGTAWANIAVAQSVPVGSLVTLDGSASTADLGRTLSYAWSLESRPSGSTASLSSATAVKPNFSTDVAGIYVVKLIVNDGTVNSTAATSSIKANAAPAANAGTAQSVIIGSGVALDGRGSSDTNGDPLTYVWTLASKPVGSNASLSSLTSATPTFIPDIPGTYVSNLVVNDGQLNSDAVSVIVKVLPNTFTIGGTVSGLTTGQSITLLSGYDLLTVSANGSFTFQSLILMNASYSVTAKTQPAGQTCTIANANGTNVTNDVANIAVKCSTNRLFSVSGTASIKNGSTVVLLLNGKYSLTLTGTALLLSGGYFTFGHVLTARDHYQVRIESVTVYGELGAYLKPQSCVIQNESGYITNYDHLGRATSTSVRNIGVGCR